MTDKELIRALRGTQSRSKRALLDEAAERILVYAAEFSCPTPDLYQIKCGGYIKSLFTSTRNGSSATVSAGGIYRTARIASGSWG